MHTDLNGLPVFVAVVESGSFARAAGQLHVTRSAVGKAIARLEERLGVALFLRTTRSQTLTEEGEILYQQASLALKSLREAEDEIQRGKTTVKGRLRISLPVLYGQRCITPVLFDLMRVYPQLKLELSFSDRQVNLVEEGFDMAVRIGALADSSTLRVRRLGQHGMILCAATGYLLHNPAPETLADLQTHPAIGYQIAGRTQSWHLKDERQRPVDFRANTRMLMDDFAAIAAAVSQGIGIAWLPDWLVAQDIAQGKMQQIMPESTDTTFEINAVWPNAAWVPQKIRVVVDALLAALPA